MPTPREQLADRLRNALSAAGMDPRRAEIAASADSRFGDYQSNAARVQAKERKGPPRQVAAEILAHLDVSGISAAPEIAGAGFINFRLENAFLASSLGAIAGDGRFGVSPAHPPRRIILDFSSPNVAKPMHVGHIRSTILGDALARIARFLGHEVVTDNHIGDWGTQFGKVIYGWKHFLDREALGRDAIAELVRLYREVNRIEESDENVKREAREELVRLQATGIAAESEGALCIFFPDIPALVEKPAIVRKSDGGFLYATTDLATLEYRAERWHPDAVWYVVGAPQSLHFQQMFAAARKMGVRADLEHIAFGSILGEDRKIMKTRSGENVGLADVLTEAVDRARRMLDARPEKLPADEVGEIAHTIGLGAVKYAELSQHRLSDYVFSWDKLLALDGNTAPYLQNAYVRIRSIFRRAGESADLSAPATLDEPAERALAIKILQYAETVPLVLDDFRPNLLANFLYELANTYHSFYEACPVLKAAPALRASRLLLSELTGRTLAHGLSLLGIRCPDRM